MENILVFHLFDNSVYFGTGSDGSKLAPVKIDGKYHIIGDPAITANTLCY
jgi:hypothetical protein